MGKPVDEKLGTLVKWNEKLHLYEIADNNEQALSEFIKKNTSREITTLDTASGGFTVIYEPITKIESETDNKLVWKKRTNLNKKKKEIETKRKQAVAIMINSFVEYCKGIESQLDQASKQLTRLLNEYKPKSDTAETQTPKKYVITITTENAELVKQIETLVYENGAVWNTVEK